MQKKNLIKIQEVNEYDAFIDLKKRWHVLYNLDSTSTPYISWAFIKGWIDGFHGTWSVLIAISENKSSEYFGLMVVGFDQKDNSICMGGNPLSDHTGFLCKADYEESVFGGFARYIIDNYKWDVFKIYDIYDSRVNIFYDFFSKNNCIIDILEPTACPFVELPDEWEDYLTHVLGKRTRYDVRQAFKLARKIDTFELVCTNKENYDKQVKALMELWQTRWGKLKADILIQYNYILLSCFENDILNLLVCWDGDQPVGAVSAFLDKNKKQVFAYINCFNMEYKKLRSAGQAVQAFDIHNAISSGYNLYDFTRGPEKYKYLLGAKNRFNSNYVIYKWSIYRVIKISIKNILKTVNIVIRNKIALVKIHS